MKNEKLNSLIEDLKNYIQKYYTLLTEFKKIEDDDEYILKNVEIHKELKILDDKIISIKSNIRKEQIKSCNEHLFIVLAIKIQNNKEIYSLKCVNCKKTFLILNGLDDVNNSNFIYLFNSKNDYYNNNDTLLYDLQEKIIHEFERFIENHTIEEAYKYIYNKYNKKY